MSHAGIVDQDIDAPFTRGDFIHMPGERFQIAQIDFGQIESVHAYAVFTQERRDGFPNTTAMPRDNRDFVFESR